MKIMNFVGLVLIMGSNLALARDHFDGGHRSFTYDKKPYVPEIVEATGWIKCDTCESCNGSDCDMIFIDSQSKKETDIVDSKKLANLHCEKKSDLKVKIKAEKTPRFLFWGGNLVVKNFEVLDEKKAEGRCLASVDHSTQQNFKTEHHFIDRR